MITRNPDLRLVYDDRAKEERDRLALRVDTFAEGLAEGLAGGKLVGQVQLL